MRLTVFRSRRSVRQIALKILASWLAPMVLVLFCGQFAAAQEENGSETALRIEQQQIFEQLQARPDDLDAMRRFAGTLFAEGEQRTHVHIASDASIDPGGCRYRSGDSVVDAGLDAQVNQIARLVLPAEEKTA